MIRKKIENIDNLLQVPDDIVFDAVKNIHSEEEKEEINKILENYKIYKEAEMTPIFLMDVVTYEFFCVARETFCKKLH